MQTATLEQLEADIRLLPLTDQLRLMERLAASIRHAADANSDREHQLALMAQDPDVQRELRQIETEFAGTEMDGLEAP